MECRSACGACCIAPSIAEGFYGMPNGKAANEPCIHLDAQMRCALFGDTRRPAVCAAFAPEPGVCGESRTQALELIAELERVSSPEFSEVLVSADASAALPADEANPSRGHRLGRTR